MPENEQVTQIRIKHSQKTANIQNITFITENGGEVEFKASLEDGKVTNINLQEGDKVVGVFGYSWSTKQPEIVGLGFVIWCPI